MPKSKRAKVVTLTKTVSKGREGKAKQIEKLQELAEAYKTIYVYSVESMRTKLFQDLRNKLRDNSRFYMGKKSLVKLAFGASKEESYMTNLYKLVEELYKVDSPEVGILFTNEKMKVIERTISNVTQSEFARGGFVPSMSLEKEEGLLEGFPTSMFEHLRKLKLPVMIKKGTIELISPHKLCVEGEPLTPEQAEVLKLLGHKLATFKINLLVRYQSGKLKLLGE